jgi:gamma-glutamyltranspeptidase/glutathione hydrolase
MNTRLHTVLLLALTLLASCAPTPRTASTYHDTFARAAVAADHHLASAAGASMLAKGGNAVDAAVAASFTLSAVRPYSCGIGGGGFMLIALPNDPTHGPILTAINHRETSPYGPTYYTDTGNSSTTGGAAVAIPGTVAGLLHALVTYGTLDRATVMQPAINAARDGFIADHHYESMAKRLTQEFEKHPTHAQRFPLVWNHFLQQGTVRVGDRITNEPQARALQLIADYGPSAFYEGPIADAIIAAIESSGGHMTRDQLAHYQPDETKPLTHTIARRTYITMPPPSSGGITMLQTLLLLRPHIDPIQATTPEYEHLLVEALKHSFADRARLLADPNFVDIPVDAMLDEAALAPIAQSLDTPTTHTPDHYGTDTQLPDDSGTSHVSVIDQWGGAVALTETINLEFGSLVGVDEFGFVLNNEMDDFTTIPDRANAFGLLQSTRNLPEPGKRPLSSMSPTIVLDTEGNVQLVAGASGGPRIITATLQVLLTTLRTQDPTTAITRPRLHHQWQPNAVYILDSQAVGDYAHLTTRGHEIRTRADIGNVQILYVHDRTIRAASDPNKHGRPAGLD